MKTQQHVRNVVLFLLSPFIGLVYAMLLPFVGLGMLAYFSFQSSKPKTTKEQVIAPLCHVS